MKSFLNSWNFHLAMLQKFLVDIDIHGYLAPLFSKMIAIISIYSNSVIFEHMSFHHWSHWKVAIIMDGLTIRNY